MATRRQFLKTSSGSLLCWVVSASSMSVLTACDRRSENITQAPERFPQGVASGDPQTNRVALWTRCPPVDVVGDNQAQDVSDLVMQVALDDAFENLVAEEKIAAAVDDDHTVRVIVEGLEPRHTYFYRFIVSGRFASPTGRTKTAPDPASPVPVNFAWVGCQQYEICFFSPWSRMIAEDRAKPEGEQLDFVVTLGDYIYAEITNTDPDAEWLDDWRKLEVLRNLDGSARLISSYETGSPPGDMEHANTTLAVTLEDYRHNYRTVLSDPDLQKARAWFPMVNIWDDGELELYRAHTHFTEARRLQRLRVTASRVWAEYHPAILNDLVSSDGIPQPAHEWQPVAVPDEESEVAPWSAEELACNDSLTIYRTFRWGALLELILTDCRSYDSRPLDHGFDKAGLGLDAIKGAPPRLVRILDEGEAYNDGKPPQSIEFGGKTVPNPRAGAPVNSVLGQKQKAWFKNALKTSSAKWKVWAATLPAYPLRLDLDNAPGWEGPLVSVRMKEFMGAKSETRELMEFVRAEKLANIFSITSDRHMFALATLVDDEDAEIPQPVMPQFGASTLASTTAKYGFVRDNPEPGDPLRPAFVYETQDGAEILNWNVVFTDGVRAAFEMARTGDYVAARELRNPAATPGLEFIDIESNGYAHANVTEDRAEVTYVAVEQPRRQFGADGPPVTYRMQVTLPEWSPQGRPRLGDLQFTGTPPYPYR